MRRKRRVRAGRGRGVSAIVGKKAAEAPKLAIMCGQQKRYRVSTSFAAKQVHRQSIWRLLGHSKFSPNCVFHASLTTRATRYFKGINEVIVININLITFCSNS